MLIQNFLSSYRSPFQFKAPKQILAVTNTYDASRYNPGRYDASGKYNPAVDNSGRYVPDNSGAYK